MIFGLTKLEIQFILYTSFFYIFTIAKLKNDIIQNKPWLIKTYGEGNLIDSSITAQSGFISHSKDDFYIKIDFNDGWKLQQGNLVTDQSFFTNRNMNLEDISNGNQLNKKPSESTIEVKAEEIK